MRLLLLILLLFVELTGCAASPNKSSKIEDSPSSETETEDGESQEVVLVSFEEAQQLFLTYRDDMETVMKEFALNFEYINIDVDSDGKLTCIFALKGDLDNTFHLDLEGLSEYTDQTKLISDLFKELNLSRMSYTSETANHAACMSFELFSQTKAIPGSDHSQHDECGIVHSTQPFGEYTYLDGDWFYYQSVL